MCQKMSTEEVGIFTVSSFLLSPFLFLALIFHFSTILIMGASQSSVSYQEALSKCKRREERRRKEREETLILLSILVVEGDELTGLTSTFKKLAKHSHESLIAAKKGVTTPSADDEKFSGKVYFSRAYSSLSLFSGSFLFFFIPLRS